MMTQQVPGPSPAAGALTRLPSNVIEIYPGAASLPFIEQQVTKPHLTAQHLTEQHLTEQHLTERNINEEEAVEPLMLDLLAIDQALTGDEMVPSDGASSIAGEQRVPGRRRLGSDAGMATAEYAIATLAAVGFAGLLVVILKSDEVRGFLLNIIRTALSM